MWTAPRRPRSFCISTDPCTAQRTTHRTNITLQSREQLEPLAVQNGVNVVFSGHYHSYERTCAVMGGACVEASSANGETNAPVHIMVGSGGAYVDTATYMDMSWSEERLQQYGYGHMHIYNASHAHFEFVRNMDGAVADSVWLQASATLGKDNGKITSASGRSSFSIKPASSALSAAYIVVIVAASVVVFVMTAFCIAHVAEEAHHHKELPQDG